MKSTKICEVCNNQKTDSYHYYLDDLQVCDYCYERAKLKAL